MMGIRHAFTMSVFERDVHLNYKNAIFPIYHQQIF